ncbi:unnamed protein product [Closterium sp. Naga37s-1]|nr:unnamed protein product [Closterium sp. Naga37s-1]
MSLLDPPPPSSPLSYPPLSPARSLHFSLSLPRVLPLLSPLYPSHSTPLLPLFSTPFPSPFPPFSSHLQPCSLSYPPLILLIALPSPSHFPPPSPPHAPVFNPPLPSLPYTPLTQFPSLPYIILPPPTVLCLTLCFPLQASLLPTPFFRICPLCLTPLYPLSPLFITPFFPHHAFSVICRATPLFLSSLHPSSPFSISLPYAHPPPPDTEGYYVRCDKDDVVWFNDYDKMMPDVVDFECDGIVGFMRSHYGDSQ